MADIKKTVEIVFSGSGNLAATTGNIASSVQDLSQPLSDAAANILKMNAALGTLALGGLVAGFVKAKEFESSLLDLKKLIGEQPEQLGEAERVAISLSNTYGQSSTEILASVANFKQAGFTLQEAFGLAEQAQKAVIAGDIDIARATNLIISSLKGFGAEAADTGRILDIVNAVSEQSGANFEKIATGLSLAAPSAKAANLSYAETVSIVSQMAEVFQSGEIAGRALSVGLGRLIDDSGPVKEALDSLGISQQKANGDLRDGGDIFKDLAGEMQGLSDTQQLYISNQIFGIDQGKKFVLVLRDMEKTAQLTATGLAGVGSSLDKEVNTRLTGSEIAVKRFIASFSNLGVAVGGEYDKAIAGVINKGSKLNIVLQEQIDAGKFDELFALIRKGADEVSSALDSIADNLPDALSEVDFTELVKSIGGAGSAILDLFDIDASDFEGEGLSGFIQSTVDALTALINVGAGVTRGIEPVVDTIKNLIEVISALDPDVIKGIGLALGTAFAVNTTAGVVRGISGFAGALSDAGLKLNSFDVAKLKNISQGTKLLGAAGLATAAGTLAINAFFDALNQNLDDQEAASKANTDAQLAEEERKRKLIVESVQRQFKELGFEYKEGWEGIGKLRAEGLAVQSGTSAENNIVIDIDDTKLREFIARKDLEKATQDFIDLKAPAKDALVVVEDIGTAAIDTGDKIKKVDEESEKFRATLAKIASDERRKVFEFSADIKVAQIDSDSKKVVASFDSIGDSVGAVSDILSELFGALGNDKLSRFDKLNIQSNIDEQVKLQKESLDLQRRLIEAELERQRIQNKILQEGGGFINITLEGVEPELEMIMFKIIERVQARVNEQGLPTVL